MSTTQTAPAQHLELDLNDAFRLLAFLHAYRFTLTDDMADDDVDGKVCAEIPRTKRHINNLLAKITAQIDRQVRPENKAETSRTEPSPVPFDLRRGMAGEPIVTRAGTKMHFIAYREDIPPYEPSRFPLFVGKPDGTVVRYEKGGQYQMLSCGHTEHPEDLLMAFPEKPRVRGWVNLYLYRFRPDGPLVVSVDSVLHASRHHADAARQAAKGWPDNARVACVEIDIDEGHGSTTEEK